MSTYDFVMIERTLGPRPSRLGTRRTRGASRREAAPSLDTEKQLATTDGKLDVITKKPKDQTMRQWLAERESKADWRAKQWMIHGLLLDSVTELSQLHRNHGDEEEALKWFKQREQLKNCQAQWVAYRAACCANSTRSVAVPIGCNHRMCPMCAAHRSSLARTRIRTMFDRLTHPALITLTIPSRPAPGDGTPAQLRKHDYTRFRQMVRQFIAQHKPWILGGVYSIETTYNRNERTWHIHAHILADLSAALPNKTEKTVLAGSRVFAFTAMKLKLEFDWLRLQGTQWGKKRRSNACDRMIENGEIYTFEKWVRTGREMALREYRDGCYRPIEGLSERARELRTAWNRENRRVIDLRPVVDRDGAAREVLKYLTKSADFAEIPDAVEMFMNAVRGARLIQTFGTWYGVKLDDATNFDPENLPDWGEMKCSCGRNSWERIPGTFFRSDVYMDATGRWHLHSPIEHSTRGTVPRPTIRALDAIPEDRMEDFPSWQIQ